MKTEINIASMGGYILYNGKLTAYEFNSARLNFATGEVEYDCILGGVQTTLKTTDDLKVYKDEEAYKRGDSYRSSSYPHSGLLNDTIGDVEDYDKAYRIEDGRIVECEFPLEGFVVYKYGRSKYEGETKFYASRDEAILHCDIVKVESDGTEVRCPSVASLVALDEEQKDALKAVEEALKRVGELGVAFCHDADGDGIYAYSTKHIADRTWDCGCGIIESYGYAIDSLLTPVDVKAYYSTHNMYDVKMYVKFKEE